MTTILSRWGIQNLAIHAKRYHEIHLDWAAMGALVELWHPQTHTFHFKTFEATIIMKEAEILLGLKWMKRGDEDDMAIRPRSISSKEVLESFMDERAARDIQATKGIELQKLAAWTTREMPRSGDDTRLEKSPRTFTSYPSELVSRVSGSEFGLLVTYCTMAPRRRPREGVADQVTRQEAGDAPPPQQTQPLPQDAHSGIAPPPPPPQVAQGLDMTRFLEGMAQFVAQHRDAPVPQGGTGKVLREFLQFQPPQFLGQPDPDAARAWLDAVERTFRSMECVPEERVLLASYQLQAQALTWWSSEWETTFQSRPLRQIPWQEFVVSFERAFCPTYVRTKRLYQFLDLQQRDFTVVQYRARFVELGRYAPQIMADEGLRTQQFVRGLRPELRQALIVARVTDLDAAY
ncbi:hypothetical protein Taro_041104 [Colocasia esculenta]|uniref:Retrotransposon gag domain-containing protein n=1 Tax=Colocasia esculenta TaxID=4460 RepID=A0A843WSF9_COLES|nr:hypothetical protein [Colocasia esculenta]